MIYPLKQNLPPSGRDGCPPERAHVGCFFETGSCSFDDMPAMMAALDAAPRFQLNMSDEAGRNIFNLLERSEATLVKMETFRHHSNWWR